MQNPDPLKIYKEHLALLDDQLKNLLRKKNRLAWLRFFSLMAAGIALWQLWPLNWILALIVSVFLIALFLFFVTRDINNRESIENTKRLTDINEEEIDILLIILPTGPTDNLFCPNIMTMPMILTSSAKHHFINTSTALILSREINYLQTGYYTLLKLICSYNDSKPQKNSTRLFFHYSNSDRME